MATQPTLKDYIGIAPASGLELAELVEKGLPTKNLDLLKAKGLTFTEMANIVISPRTLKHRKARGERRDQGTRTLVGTLGRLGRPPTTRRSSTNAPRCASASQPKVTMSTPVRGGVIRFAPQGCERIVGR